MRLRDYIKLENKTCICGKISFDKKGAQSKRNQLLKLGKESYLRIYQCAYSDTWHLTSELKNKHENS